MRPLRQARLIDVSRRESPLRGILLVFMLSIVVGFTLVILIKGPDAIAF